MSDGGAPHLYAGARSRVRVRPARPEDAAALGRMLAAEAPDDIRLRFFRHVRTFPASFVEPLLRVDGRRHFALVAEKAGRGPRLVGSAMLVADAAGREAEFGILVARAEAGQGLGSHLLDCLVQEARSHGIGSIFGVILDENHDMIDLARRRGFTITPEAGEPGCVRATLRLRAAPGPH